MPLSTTTPVGSGPGQCLVDGIQFQAGPTSSDQSKYPTVYDASAGAIVAAQFSDAVSLIRRPGRLRRIAVSCVPSGAPAPTAFDGDLLGSVDGVNFNVLLQKFNTAAGQTVAGIECAGVNFLQFRLNSMDQGKLTVIISE